MVELNPNNLIKIGIYNVHFIYLIEFLCLICITDYLKHNKNAYIDLPYVNNF